MAKKFKAEDHVSRDSKADRVGVTINMHTADMAL